MELIGAELDIAVGKAAGIHFELWGDAPVLPGLGVGQAGSNVTRWAPSEVWSQGGPIIERERITIVASTGYKGADGPVEWSAAVGPFAHYIDEALYGGHPTPGGEMRAVGPTPLIAAMRAFVASKA